MFFLYPVFVGLSLYPVFVVWRPGFLLFVGKYSVLFVSNFFSSVVLFWLCALESVN